MKPITCYFIRHGQTWFNRFNKMQGWSDSPLTDQGLADGDRTGLLLAHVHFANAYSSDTMRAYVTAQHILAANQDPTTKLTRTPFFREEFYGYFEGTDSPQTWFLTGALHDVHTRTEIVEQYGLDASKDFMHEADPFRAAEDAKTYWARLAKGFDLVRHENPAGGNVLVVSHGTTIRSLADKYGRGRFDIRPTPKNGSITTVVLTDDDIEVTSFNQTSLPAAH